METFWHWVAGAILIIMITWVAMMVLGVILLLLDWLMDVS